MALRQIKSLDELTGIKKGTEVILTNTRHPVYLCVTALGRYEEWRNSWDYDFGAASCFGVVLGPAIGLGSIQRRRR